MILCFIRAGRFFPLLALVAWLGINTNAFTDELFAPVELERLRQVSRALLASRAAERQRLLDASTIQRQALVDVDDRLRTLEAAVRADNMPRMQTAPKPPTGASANTLRLKATAAKIEPAMSKLRSLASANLLSSSRVLADASGVEHGKAGNSAEVVGHIDDVLASVSEHRRSLSRRSSSVSARPLTNAARLSTTAAVSFGAPSKDAQARVTDALNVVDLELRRMRVDGADLRRLHSVRQQLSLSGPPATRAIEPTFQTITRHYH